ncbi:sugar ABC transporter permease [Bacillaceae bacterium Marseille-Q3522]|nr:sugar ABC transporter permease [Bacillaceae bacterium Marseille-Q3522]
MKKSYRKANIMYIPVLLIFITFIVYPFLSGIRLSFTDWNGFSQSFHNIGLQNFQDMLADPYVKRALLNTLIYGFGSTLFQQILGLGYALLLNNKFPLRGAARTFIYLPVLIPGIVMGYMWYFIAKYENGALNDVLSVLGFEPIYWLTDEKLAIFIILIINITQFCGISMVIYAAGLQNIPHMYYEAASLDGAGKWQMFKKITLPLLYPSIVTSVIINLIGGLKLFDVIRALTNGGPNYTTHSLSSLINSTYFEGQNAGYAASQGILLFVVILVLTLFFQVLFSKRKVDFS